MKICPMPMLWLCCKFLLRLTPTTNRFTEMLNAGVSIGQKLDFANHSYLCKAPIN
ncbi:hypothetical protein [uncultured Gammaproteobacteria bacterium]|nr:hypothetical protein [uncultured Gammaproteobacteria bacterium]